MSVIGNKYYISGIYKGNELYFFIGKNKGKNNVFPLKKQREIGDSKLYDYYEIVPYWFDSYEELKEFYKTSIFYNDNFNFPEESEIDGNKVYCHF